jgi:hypothetical protein
MCHVNIKYIIKLFKYYYTKLEMLFIPHYL